MQKAFKKTDKLLKKRWNHPIPYKEKTVKDSKSK